jgi:hypothetical protein
VRRKKAESTEPKKAAPKEQKTQSSVTEAKDDEGGDDAPAAKPTSTKTETKTESAPKQESGTVSVTNAPDDDGVNEAPSAAPIKTESTPTPAPVEAPQTVVAAPAVESPQVESPIVESPVVETPAVEAPTIETPVIDTPVIEVDVASITEAAAEVATTVSNVVSDVTNTVTEITQEETIVEEAEKAVTGKSPSEILNTIDIDDSSIEKTATESGLGADAYLEYGYWSSDTVSEDVYASGVITPSQIVEDLMTNVQPTMSYYGSVSAIVTDLDGIKSHAGGSIDLSVNFQTSAVSGYVEVDNWGTANINSAALTADGFSGSMSGVTADSVSDITGDIDGNFYGTEAQAVGGTFNLESPTSGSVNGSFGATGGVQ